MIRYIIAYCYYRIERIPSNIYNYVLLKFHNADIGKGTRILGKLKLVGAGKLICKENVIINSHIKYNPIGGQSGSIMYIDNCATVFIDMGTGISNITICAQVGVYIGKNVCIGGDCRIYDTDFHSISLSERLEKPDVHVKKKKITICDGVFIGASSIILKGVTIGENSVIGAGSVVTKDIPANEIWAGNPVKFVKKI